MPSLPGLLMTVCNLRELGVRSLAVTCELCHHEAPRRHHFGGSGGGGSARGAGGGPA